jgi:transporter family protein
MTMTPSTAWFVAIFAFAFLGERPTTREWTGIIRVASGVLVLAFKR